MSNATSVVRLLFQRFAQALLDAAAGFVGERINSPLELLIADLVAEAFGEEGFEFFALPYRFNQTDCAI